MRGERMKAYCRLGTDLKYHGYLIPAIGIIMPVLTELGVADNPIEKA
ncbi:hypothetical protein ASTA108788_06840 [Asticcacaulis taihuensis]|uniref:Uncharacterized protein n=1 Tax=Asticcacaulis taihuensis TaxID=260084 RepID=A0A1G4PCI7_9CAUL|nr:hypothetical protein SAMN02927928_0255 [Asticcacaulis taihuensis]